MSRCARAHIPIYTYILEDGLGGKHSSDNVHLGTGGGGEVRDSTYADPLLFSVTGHFNYVRRAQVLLYEYKKW